MERAKLRAAVGAMMIAWSLGQAAFGGNPPAQVPPTPPPISPLHSGALTGGKLGLLQAATGAVDPVVQMALVLAFLADRLRAASTLPQSTREAWKTLQDFPQLYQQRAQLRKLDRLVTKLNRMQREAMDLFAGTYDNYFRKYEALNKHVMGVLDYVPEKHSRIRDHFTEAVDDWETAGDLTELDSLLTEDKRPAVFKTGDGKVWYDRFVAYKAEETKAATPVVKTANALTRQLNLHMAEPQKVAFLVPHAPAGRKPVHNDAGREPGRFWTRDGGKNFEASELRLRMQERCDRAMAALQKERDDLNDVAGRFGIITRLATIATPMGTAATLGLAVYYTGRSARRYLEQYGPNPMQIGKNLLNPHESKEVIKDREETRLAELSLEVMDPENLRRAKPFLDLLRETLKAHVAQLTPELEKSRGGRLNGNEIRATLLDDERVDGALLEALAPAARATSTQMRWGEFLKFLTLAHAESLATLTPDVKAQYLASLEDRQKPFVASIYSETLARLFPPADRLTWTRGAGATHGLAIDDTPLAEGLGFVAVGALAKIPVLAPEDNRVRDLSIFPRLPKAKVAAVTPASPKALSKPKP